MTTASTTFDDAIRAIRLAAAAADPMPHDLPVDDYDRTVAHDNKPADDAAIHSGEDAPTATTTTTTTHNGTRIYLTMVKSGGEVVTRFAVESPDNKARREAGERTIGGDSLHATMEGAKAAADLERKQKGQKEARDAAQKAESAAKAQVEATRKADDLNGFTAPMSAMQAGKVKTALEKQVRFDGVVMTLRDRVESLHYAGKLSVETFEEPAIKPLSRTQFNRATQREQDAHEAKMKAAGNKTVYLVNGSDIGKTAYEYALFLHDQDHGQGQDQDLCRTKKLAQVPDQNAAHGAGPRTEATTPDFTRMDSVPVGTCPANLLSRHRTRWRPHRTEDDRRNPLQSEPIRNHNTMRWREPWDSVATDPPRTRPGSMPPFHAVTTGKRGAYPYHHSIKGYCPNMARKLHKPPDHKATHAAGSCRQRHVFTLMRRNLTSTPDNRAA